MRWRALFTPFVAVLPLALAACGGGGSGTAATGGAAVALRSAQIEGIGPVVTTAEGLTLYYLAPEDDGSIQCEGDCTRTWPPLIVAAGATPSASAELTGKVGTIQRPDGTTQATYDGWPLYRYAGDTAPGEANGNGKSNVWFPVQISGGPTAGPPSRPDY